MNKKKAIQENLYSLKIFLKNEMYLQTSGPLRVLLCDYPDPLLTDYASDINRPLSVWSSMNFEEISENLLDGLQTAIRHPCKWDPQNLVNPKKLLFKDFIDRKFCAAADGNRYSPKQIIKASANKLGIAHFDKNRQKYLRDTLKIKFYDKSDGTNQKTLAHRHLIDLSNWTINAIKYLLSDEIDFSVYFAFDKIGNSKGKFNLWCVQTGILFELKIQNNSIIITTKSQNIKLNKKDNSYICIKGSNGDLEIITNLLNKNKNISYSNIVTENSLRSKMNITNIKGNAYVYSRLLNSKEIDKLKNKEVRNKLDNDIRS